ncbi:NAD(P)H-dependent flavin oxidoreductase [Mycolicibacterium tokaiense]|uniref:Propionate 3-nitronate monooxygenase n=1 Tax=Mycolicibacterium tokaiense TaxID=39695 RepID=A0A378TLX3_9MYCO|nr:nitronate monooxygenase [Mycolicibacterium tokaiense]BBY90055.1 oxidoreductase [Mycolicibacterium tokaiense]STZ61564.1 oxidoreductase [Mycolicibacterium tokaiense]
MTSLLTNLGLDIPVIAAPMAGGATTPAMVIAAADAGGVGFVPAGYKAIDALQADITAVRQASVPFGVNVFAPNPVPISPADYRAYAAQVQREADRFGVTLPAEPKDDDDAWAAKIDLLLSDPVPVVSFTFGLPDTATISALQKQGTVVIQTVTTAEEARVAASAGVDLLAVQASVAGGHSGTLTPSGPPTEVPIGELITQVTHAVDTPVIAAGGITSSAAVAAALHSGASAVAVGTLLLLADESGASATHQAALQDPARTETVLTRAFTGRPARGLRNSFIDTFESHAPLGYPAIHHLTSPLRKAAAAAGVADDVHLWAGTGYRQARRAPTAAILTALTSAL